MKYARVANNFAVDVRSDSPEGFFVPTLVAEFIEVPDTVENGWSIASGDWAAPVVYVPTQEEIDAEAAFKLEISNITAAAEARIKRDSLLAETDWRALSDLTMSSEMTTYRQALRDVPQQDEFPSEIDWPVEPN